MDDSMNACVPNSSPEPRFFFLPLPASPTLASLKAPRCPRRAWHSLPAPRGRPGTVVSARQVPARRARKSLASLAQAFGANCFGPQFLRPFQIREATDETVGRGGMANGLGGGGTAVPVCGGESRLEPRPPALSRSPSPRTPVSPRRDLQTGGAQLAAWCARLPGGEDNPGPSQQVRAQVWGGLVDCGAARSTVIAVGPGTCAASDKVRSSKVLAHLLLSFKRGPVRALELWKSPLTLLSFSCLL